jgi:CheY-like chemotaxis protein
VILLVLACRQLRRAAHHALVSLGYEVRATDDVRAARAYLRESEVPPDLLVIDTQLRDVPASVMADEGARRGVLVLPLASHRFQPAAGPLPVEGFCLYMLVRRIEQILGVRVPTPEAGTSNAFSPIHGATTWGIAGSAFPARGA